VRHFLFPHIANTVESDISKVVGVSNEFNLVFPEPELELSNSFF